MLFWSLGDDNVKIAISTMLDTSAERAWTEVQTSRLLEYIAWPLLTFAPIGSARLPAQWRESVHPVRLRALGLWPLGEQRIVTTKPMLGPDRYQLRDKGSGDLVSRWDHMITIESAGPSRCRYTDEVDVSAGVLTPFVWAFARIFYAHRQRRWRRLVGNDFAY